MDLKVYYRRIREIENSISDPFVVLVSLDTPDGGKVGRKSEVGRSVAAKLIAEGRCRLANDEEAAEFHGAQEEGRREAEARAAAQRMQVVVVPQVDARPSKPGRSKE
jgi:hypothetical protein